MHTGLARFCTEAYSRPTAKNCSHVMSHLTNYSLNKRSDAFVKSRQHHPPILLNTGSSSQQDGPIATASPNAESVGVPRKWEGGCWVSTAEPRGGFTLP